jgi:hypothetical protein
MSVKGVIGGAIVFDSNAVPTTIGSANNALDKYGDFSLAMDSYYHQENLSLNGIRELFFPLDNTFEQYQAPGTSKNGFSFLIYIQDGVPSVANYKVDIFVNYEALPDSTFLNYIPQSSCPPTETARKEEAIRAVQTNPIMSGEIPLKASSGKQNGIWDKIKGAVGSYLPNIATIASTLIPGGKFLSPLIQTGANMLAAVNRDKRNDYYMID